MASHKNGWWFVIRCSLNAIHSRKRRLERSLIRNPENPQSPKLPLYKEILRILPKLQKKTLTKDGFWRINAEGRLNLLWHSLTNECLAYPLPQSGAGDILPYPSNFGS